ncbi:MAG TPA: serine/threonine-protein kinase [Gemmatimonadales bacterium]
MICPRCSVAEISDDAQECTLCGYSPYGVVVVGEGVTDEVQETVQQELASRFNLQMQLERRPSSLRYVARDLEVDELVTLQLLPHQGPLDVDIVQRFEQAATAAITLRHPHVIPIRDFGLSGSLLWYTMDAIKGRPLSTILQESGPLAIGACLDLLEQLVSGLEFIHRRGLVHGAVTPRNVHIDADGWARLSDVAVVSAVARAAGEGTGWRALLTPYYAAPEQFDRHAPGPRVDQFSLARVTFDCLARPVTQTVESPDEKQDRPVESVRSPRRLEGVPAHVVTAIERAGASDPKARFATVLDFIAVLSGGQEGVNAFLAPTRRPSLQSSAVLLLPDEPIRRFHFRAVAVVFALAASALAFLFATRRAPPDEWIMIPPSTAVTTRRAPGGPAGGDVASPARPDSVSAAVAAAPAVVPAPRRAAPRPAPPPPPGALFVNARPWGVIFLDGTEIGNTPKANLAVAAGQHTLRIEREGFTPFERVIQIRSGEPLRITDVVLQPIRP